jgi:hypothetical protein
MQVDEERVNGARPGPPPPPRTPAPSPRCREYLLARQRGALGRRPSGTSGAPGKADGQRGRGGGRPELLGRPAPPLPLLRRRSPCYLAMSSHGVGADGQREGMRLGEKEEKE